MTSDSHNSPNLPFDILASQRRADAARAAQFARGHQHAIERGAKCLECPLYRKNRGPVRSEIRPGGKLAICGEAPGRQEVEEGRVFTGKSGVELEHGLDREHVTRNDTSILNVISCQPDIDGGSLGDYLSWLSRENDRRREASESELLSPLDACRPRLLKDLAEADSDVWLAVGGTALEAMVTAHGIRYGKGKDQVGDINCSTIMNQHGSPIIVPSERVAQSTVPSGRDKDRIITSTLHPAFAMRGKRAYKFVIIEDIARAARIAQRGYVDWQMPEDVFTFPSIDEIERECAQYVAANALVAVDIEGDSADTQTCRIRCVGFGAEIDGVERVIVIPFRYMSGRDYWPTMELKVRAVAATQAVLDNCQLVMHNGAYDTGVLTRVGLMSDRKKQWQCTMLAHHDTDHNDLPHTLGFVATRFLEVPMWKKDVDHKATDNIGADADLYEYNAVDVVTTLRAWGYLDERMVECGTTDQYDTDRQLAPIAREMEALGVFVDEHERGKLSRQLNQVCFRLRKKFCGAVGREINPRSPQQVAYWLFDELGLTPPLNPQGYEWQEGDGYSTSAPAIIKIIDKDGESLPPQVTTALEALLEFKSAEKLRSTYVDGLDVHYDDAFAHLERATPVTEEIYDKKGNVGNVDILPARMGISRIHPTWKIHVVPTGRWSSSPNMQNYPAYAWGGLNLRSLIIAPPGHVIVGADFEQIELRLYAVQAGDQVLLKAFHEGLDAHSLNTATLFSPDTSEEGIMKFYWDFMQRLKSTDDSPAAKKERKRCKHIRNITKRVSFLETYGGESDKLHATLSSSRDKATGKLDFPNITPMDCERWHERWHELHPETRIWQDSCAAFQRHNGYVEAIYDRRKRFFPGGPDKKNAVPNHTIQGSSAAIMNRGMLNLAEAIPFGAWSPYTGICLQVHDYAGVFVPEERADEAIEIVRECLDFEYKGLKFPVDKPLASRSWADQ